MADETEKTTMTTASGRPVEDNQHSLTAGQRGPALMQDYFLTEKMAHFNRERMPERVVHAKGYGAYGTFRVTRDITKYSCAKIFSSVGKTTELFARFSTVGGESGSADTARDPRGFAIKFYTEDGNWDLVGNNTPIFFIRDPLKFNDFIRTQKRDPGTHLKPHWRRWDYWGLSPEAIHQVMFLYSDRGTPVSARFMDGYGSHTYSLWNAKGERFWVKFHVKSRQGNHTFEDAEALKMAGDDPDFSARDLLSAIKAGEFPRWKVSIQVMPEIDAETYKWNPFDLTKVWPHGDYPLIEVGDMELNRNPENYFAEVEQAAFAPSNIVPGIGFSPDKVLQSRILSYADAHRYRIGINCDQIPVNQAKAAKVRTYHRDGNMVTGNNGGGSIDYEPNSFGGPVENKTIMEPPLKIDGNGGRYITYSGDDSDLYGQPRAFWERAMDDAGRAHLVANIVASMTEPAMGMADNIKRHEIQQRMLRHWYKVHPDFGAAVDRGIGRAREELERNDANRRRSEMVGGRG
jgi:catalase